MLTDSTLLDGRVATYHRVRAGELQAVGGVTGGFAAQAHQAFRERIQAPEFSCVAAKSAVNKSSYAFACYGELGSEAATQALAADLARFTGEQDPSALDFSTMIAVFQPGPMDEHAFEERLWAQLRALHAADPCPYSEEVSADPASPEFGFSFAGRAYFVIGLHPGSSRLARAFPYPALVFNAHHQFRRLREEGRWVRFQETIRGRELKWQGTLNPNLSDHGEASEARQYSGRAVEPDWAAPFPAAPAGKCPFGHG